MKNRLRLFTITLTDVLGKKIIDDFEIEITEDGKRILKTKKYSVKIDGGDIKILNQKTKQK